jgi:hypothetical protein
VIQEISLNPERLVSFFEKSGFNPSETLAELRQHMESMGMAEVDPRHIFASMMGMVLFPYIGRPIFEMIAFRGDSKAYNKFLRERAEHIPAFIDLAFTGAIIQKQNRNHDKA